MGVSSRDIGLPGFLLGVLAGSTAATATATLIYAHFNWRGKLKLQHDPPLPKNDNRKQQQQRRRVSYKEEVEVSEINDTETKCNNRQELHDTNGHNNNNNNDASASECNNDSTQSQSSTHQPSHQADTNPVKNSGTNENVAVITKEEWDANDEITQQSKEFDEQILSRLSSKEEMTLLLRRARAVNALAHRLTVAEDETSCFEIVSQLLVPMFRIDGCAFALLKVRDIVCILFHHQMDLCVCVCDVV